MKEITYEGRYKIITIDNFGNLLIGHLEVKNYDLLRAFRDYLTKDNFDNFKRFDRSGSCANGIKVPKIDVVDNCLVKRDNFKEEYIKTFYKEYIYKPLNLNTFLLCCSLLGEMDTVNFGTLANEFVQHGIFKCLSLEQAWKQCSKNLYVDDKSQDFETFCDLLADGRFIKYVVDDMIECRNLRGAKLLNELKVVLDDEVYMDIKNSINTKDFLREIIRNGEILGTCMKKRRFTK